MDAGRYAYALPVGEQPADERHDAPEPECVHRARRRARGLAHVDAARSGRRGRSTRAHSASTGARSTKFRSAKPHVSPSSAPSANGSRVASARTSGASVRAAASMPAEKSTPIGRYPAGSSVRHRSPVPHARSSTRAPATSCERVHRRAPPRDVHAEREQPVEEVVARRDAVEHLLDDARLLVARRGAARGVRSRRSSDVDRPLSSRRAASTLAAAISCVLADRLEVLLRDREQHAAEVVLDERGDRGQQRAERLDESLGLLVVGEVRVAQRRAHVPVEQRDGLLGDVVRRVVVLAREREQIA